MTARTELSILVPIHNEEAHLSGLFESLRVQVGVRFEVVLIENGSTDASAAMIAACPEIRARRWRVLVEPRLGKFRAIRLGTAYAVRELGLHPVAFVDADTRITDPHWARSLVEAAARSGGSFGAAFGAQEYFGIDHLPVFRAAYASYNRIVHELTEDPGWFAPGTGSAFDAVVLERYFARAEVTTEIDLRQSLLALFLGRRVVRADTAITFSGRRMVVDTAHLTAWCFYEPTFDSAKDINAAVKVDLARPPTATDLPRDLVDRFFERRARKLASRNLVPLALFDRSGTIAPRVEAMLGAVGRRSLAALRRVAGGEETFLTPAFEALVSEIDGQPAARELAEALAGRMRADQGAQPRALAAAAGG